LDCSPEYRRERTIESYIQIRRKFPEVEIQISRFGGIGGIDALFALEEDFEKRSPHWSGG
jgi:hypothetical protein